MGIVQIANWSFEISANSAIHDPLSEPIFVSGRFKKHLECHLRCLC